MIYSAAETPAIQQLRVALGEHLTSVIAGLPAHDDHPLYGRNTGHFAFSDSWSVRLWRDGFHKNHFHSQGWLSSAFYLTVPPEGRDGGRGLDKIWRAPALGPGNRWPPTIG